MGVCRDLSDNRTQTACKLAELGCAAIWRVIREARIKSWMKSSSSSLWRQVRGWRQLLASLGARNVGIEAAVTANTCSSSKRWQKQKRGLRNNRTLCIDSAESKVHCNFREEAIHPVRFALFVCILILAAYDGAVLKLLCPIPFSEYTIQRLTETA